MTTATQWDALADDLRAPTRFDALSYGEELPDEAELRLLGVAEGHRVLDLGCGLGQAAIALATGGAHVIALDASAQMLARARRLAEAAEVSVEWHHADLADLAFLRAEGIDAAVAIDSLGEVEDLDRVLRQVHRVLKPHAPFVFTLPHPAFLCVHESSDGRLVVDRGYADETPVQTSVGDQTITLYPRTVESAFASLHRASYRVDHILELEPVSGSGVAVPPVVLFRARKEGS